MPFLLCALGALSGELSFGFYRRELREAKGTILVSSVATLFLLRSSQTKSQIPSLGLNPVGASSKISLIL
jgi:hypothetical protein